MNAHVLALASFVALLLVPADTAAASSSCMSSATGGHTACIEFGPGGSVYGHLRNDSSTEQSCGDFRLNLTTYDHTGHRDEVAGDQYRKDACLAPGAVWRAYFPYVDANRKQNEYDGRTKPYYTQMCVKGYRLDPGGYELITGSACSR